MLDHFRTEKKFVANAIVSSLFGAGLNNDVVKLRRIGIVNKTFFNESYLPEKSR